MLKIMTLFIFIAKVMYANFANIVWNCIKKEKLRKFCIKL